MSQLFFLWALTSIFVIAWQYLRHVHFPPEPPSPDAWTHGSIDGFLARRHDHTGEVQIFQQVMPVQWLTIRDPFDDFLAHDQTPRTPRQHAERLRYQRMNQPPATASQVDEHFERCRRR